MNIILILVMAVDLVKLEKLDRTYLPPPGSKYAGGSPGSILAPLESPKRTFLTYQQTNKDEYQNKPERPEDSQIVLGINRGVESNSEVPLRDNQFKSLNSGTEAPSTYYPPTTTTSYAFTQTTSYAPEDNFAKRVTPYITRKEQYVPSVQESGKMQGSLSDYGPLSKTESVVTGDLIDNNKSNNKFQDQKSQKLGQLVEVPSTEQNTHNKTISSSLTPIAFRNQNVEGFTDNTLNSTMFPTSFSKMPYNNEQISTDANLYKFETILRPGVNNNLSYSDNSYSSTTRSTLKPSLEDNFQSSAKQKLYSTRLQPKAEIDRHAITLNYTNEITPDGDFAYSFDTSNGIHADESGSGKDGVKASGTYSYIGDDGIVYTVHYSADENGFQPHGDHLPTPPPIPEAIRKVIEIVKMAKVNGMRDDGKYDDSKYGFKKYDGKENYHKNSGTDENNLPLQTTMIQVKPDFVADNFDQDYSFLEPDDTVTDDGNETVITSQDKKMMLNKIRYPNSDMNRNQNLNRADDYYNMGLNLQNRIPVTANEKSLNFGLSDESGKNFKDFSRPQQISFDKNVPKEIENLETTANSKSILKTATSVGPEFKDYIDDNGIEYEVSTYMPKYGVKTYNNSQAPSNVRSRIKQSGYQYLPPRNKLLNNPTLQNNLSQNNQNFVQKQSTTTDYPRMSTQLRFNNTILPKIDQKMILSIQKPIRLNKFEKPRISIHDYNQSDTLPLSSYQDDKQPSEYSEQSLKSAGVNNLEKTSKPFQNYQKVIILPDSSDDIKSKGETPEKLNKKIISVQNSQSNLKGDDSQPTSLQNTKLNYSKPKPFTQSGKLVRPVKLSQDSQSITLRPNRLQNINQERTYDEQELTEVVENDRITENYGQRTVLPDLQNVKQKKPSKGQIPNQVDKYKRPLQSDRAVEQKVTSLPELEMSYQEDISKNNELQKPVYSAISYDERVTSRPDLFPIKQSATYSDQKTIKVDGFGTPLISFPRYDESDVEKATIYGEPNPNQIDEFGKRIIIRPGTNNEGLNEIIKPYVGYNNDFERNPEKTQFVQAFTTQPNSFLTTEQDIYGERDSYQKEEQRRPELGDSKYEKKISTSPGEEIDSTYQDLYIPSHETADKEDLQDQRTPSYTKEDFSGPKQAQKYDPETGYYYK